MKLVLSVLLSLLAVLPFQLSAQSVWTVGSTYPVDDSQSVVSRPSVTMRWDSPLPRPGHPDTATGQLLVDVVLDVSAFRGRSGKIYMKLPTQPFGRVLTSWQSRRALLAPGQLRDGERALVWSGTITTDRLTDGLLLSISVDGNQLWRTEQLHYSFEIEITP